MSKIALTPNASGTGTFTLAAPNSNTSRTITLPDEAGEVLVNGTNQNVGIGTSSPTTKIQSKGGSISTPTDNAGLIANASASFVVDHANDYGLYTGYVASANDAIGIAATRTLGSALPLSLQPFGGNVGIGTSSPDTKLHLDQTSQGNFTEAMRISNAGGGADEGNYIQFEVSNTSGYGSRIGGRREGTGGVGLHFYTGAINSAPTEAMRIDSSGNLLVGKTSTSAAVAGVKIGGNFIEVSTSGGAGLALRRLTNDGAMAVFQNSGGSTVGSISVSGSSTSYSTSSDYRLKTDAQPMTGASARVQALNPVNFEWIADGTRVDGFLAHEAQAVVPEAVTGTKDAMRDEEYEVTPAVYEDVIIPAVLDDEGNELEAERTEQQLVTEAVMGTRSVPDYQGIDQSKLVPLLTAALQEALTEISDLKARVVALEAV